MPKPTGPTNPIVKKLAEEIHNQGYKGNSKFLIRLAELIEKPSRRKKGVSLAKLNRIAKENETVVVVDKVLDGLISKPLDIAAISFSHKAKISIEKVGGKHMTIKELIHKNPKGSNVRIVT